MASRMTNAEAIETLRANYPDVCFEQLREAVDKAIKALEEAEWEELLVICDHCGHVIHVKREKWAKEKCDGEQHSDEVDNEQQRGVSVQDV